MNSTRLVFRLTIKILMFVSGRITLGSGPGVDIPVQGTGVLPLHCHIENSEGIVTIYPLSENLSIDGVRANGPTRLSQGKYIYGISTFQVLFSLVIYYCRVSCKYCSFFRDCNKMENYFCFTKKYIKTQSKITN